MSSCFLSKQNQFRVLVVDDSPMACTHMRQLLEQTSIKMVIEECTTFLEAVRLLKDTAYDYVFLDYILEDTDGLQLIQVARNFGNDSKFIIVTAHEERLVEALQEKHNAFSYICKNNLTIESIIQHMCESMHQANSATRAVAKEITEQYEHTLNTLTEGVVQLDFEGNIRFVNQALETMFDLPEEKCLNQPFQTAFNLITPFITQTVLQEALSPKMAPVGEKSLFHGCFQISSEYVTRYFEYRILPFHSSSMTARIKPSGLVVVFTDITEQQQSSQSLSKLAALANQANHAKSDFIANMSHEIRTPLNGIIGMLDMSLDTDLDTQQHKQISTARASAEHLLSVINDILDFSKIEADRLEFDYQLFSLHQTLREALAVFKVQAREKGVRLISSLDDDLPDLIVGDSLRLKQILINLIGNALKFTTDGKVELLVQLSQFPLNPNDEHPKALIEFAVSDTGIGIEPDKQKEIFQAFSQGDTSITRVFGGTGLGLTLSNRLVKEMYPEDEHAQIHVKSVPQEGSTFWFSLPFAVQNEVTPPKSSTELAPPKRKASTQSKPEALTVLLAEDNPINEEVTRYLLTKEGHQVFSVQNGELAVQFYQDMLDGKQPHVDLILMDLQMPIMGGYQACHTIRHLEERIINPKPP